MLHGPRRRRAARRVRDARHPGRGPCGDDDRGARPRVARRGRGVVRRVRRIAVRVLHARDHHALRGRAGARRRPCARRAPLPVHRLADGARRDRGGRARPVARDLGARGAAGRARGRCARNASAPTCRSAARRSPTTPRRATRSLRSRCRRASAAEAIEAAGLRWVVGESLLDARTRAGQGAGPPHDRRGAAAACSIACRRARPVASRSRRSGSSPRTSNPTRRGARRAASPRRRSRTAARSAASSRSAAPRGGARARRPARPHRARRVLARGRRAARPEAPADRRGRASRDGGVVEIDGVVGARLSRRHGVAGAESRRRAHWTEVDVPGPPVSAELRAVGLAEQAMLVAGALGRERRRA